MAFSDFFSSKSKASMEQHRPVAITRELTNVIIKHEGKPFEISRTKDNDAVILPMYAKTSRPCPPFCIQPMEIEPGIKNIGELELIQYLVQKSEGDDSLAIIDSRTADWVLVATIPGTTNVPWISLSREVGVTAAKMVSVLKKDLDVKIKNEGAIDKYFDEDNLSALLDFSDAKTLVLFCNGVWCEQSAIQIRSLLHLGYPAEKIIYYRDGMQGWVGLGFPTVP